MNEAASELNCSLEEDEARKKAERKLRREERGTLNTHCHHSHHWPLPVMSQAAALWVRPKQAWLTMSGRGTWRPHKHGSRVLIVDVCSTSKGYICM